jgi:predicted RND superfamily exporter protein
MIPAIVRNQVGSVLLAPLACWLVISLLHRSALTGALAVLPAAVAVVWVFGLMGWVGMPLGVATSMFCAITLGIGVDYAVHLLERHRDLRRRGEPGAVAGALAQAGPAIAADSLAIAGGFGLLAVSQVQANARLGVLVAAALLSACLLTLLGLAAVLAAGERKRPAPLREGEGPG